MIETLQMLRELMPDVAHYRDAWLVGEARDRELITAAEWYEFSSQLTVEEVAC